MRHDRWKEIDDLFQQVLDLSPGRRRAFLDDLAARDEELHRSVEELLRALEDSGPFLLTPVDQACSPPWDEVFPNPEPKARPDRDDRTAERIGPYRLVRRLGRGGMATVYLAERADGLWDQEVALKLIRRGLDSDDVVRRFLAERQILSSLRHANIASLLDGGTTRDGLPYLVMEYVEGTPITEYCDQRRLSIEARLGLFREVGRAVQHAHRSLIVHRDLKPSNILVTAEGRVKLLDFGIAKLLDPESDPDAAGLTRPGHRPLTPEYASPEQFAGGPITTASDVYQLGVLLYRLLCGRRPHGAERAWPLGDRGRAPGAAPDPPSRVVTMRPATGSTEAEPSAPAWRRRTTPERLSRRLRGDLDTIVAKAMDEEPGERYDSVAALVEDIERNMEELPIRARAPTRRYRLRKFLKRNAWVAPVTAAALLGAGLYAFTTHRQAGALERERNLARAEAERADEIRAFTTDLFRSADPFAPADPERGRQITVAEALEIGTNRVRAELAGRPALQASLLGTISDVYESLDLDARAESVRREALDRARGVHGPESAEAARHLWSLGNLVAEVGTRDSAESLLRSALALIGRHHGERDTAYASVLVDLGYLAIDQGRHEEAARHLERAVAILEGSEPPGDRRLAGALGALATVYPHLNRPREATRAGGRSLEHFRGTLGPEHPRTAMAMAHLASTYDGVGEPRRAVELYRSALPIMERTLGAGHSETMNTRNNQAVSLLAAGEPERAEEAFRRIVELHIEQRGERHEYVADGLQNLAATLTRQGELDEAEAALSRAHRIYLDVLETGHYQTALPLLTLSEIRFERGDFAGAEASASEAARILRRALPEGHYITAVAECRWGRALAGSGLAEEATPLLATAAASLQGHPRAVRHEEDCLAAAVDHLRSVGALRERWAPFAERLEELRHDSLPPG